MRILLALEETGLVALAIAGLYLQPVSLSWWGWIILFLSPDISMLAYLFGSRPGAWLYNIFHHKGLAAIIIISGYFFGMPYLLLAGLILFAHSSFDRMCGFGLKYPDGFKKTHLGNLQ